MHNSSLGWTIKNGAVLVELGVPEVFQYRTRILRLEEGYLAGETWLQPLATANAGTFEANQPSL
jgi:hypothetical protein